MLPEAWQDKARALGAFRRARLGELAQIRDVAILKRLRGCGAWFEWMCRELRRQWLPERLSPVLASCWSGRRIRLIDATMLSEPGLTGSRASRSARATLWWLIVALPSRRGWPMWPLGVGRSWCG